MFRRAVQKRDDCVRWASMEGQLEREDLSVRVSEM